MSPPPTRDQYKRPRSRSSASQESGSPGAPSIENHQPGGIHDEASVATVNPARRRQRRAFGAEERREVAAVRRIQACSDCRRRKVKCKHARKLIKSESYRPSSQNNPNRQRQLSHSRTLSSDESSYSSDMALIGSELDIPAPDSSDDGLLDVPLARFVHDSARPVPAAVKESVPQQPLWQTRHGRVEFGDELQPERWSEEDLWEYLSDLISPCKESQLGSYTSSHREHRLTVFPSRNRVRWENAPYQLDTGRISTQPLRNRRRTEAVAHDQSDTQPERHQYEMPSVPVSPSNISSPGSHNQMQSMLYQPASRPFAAPVSSGSRRSTDEYNVHYTPPGYTAYTASDFERANSAHPDRLYSYDSTQGQPQVLPSQDTLYPQIISPNIIVSPPEQPLPVDESSHDWMPFDGVSQPPSPESRSAVSNYNSVFGSLQWNQSHLSDSSMLMPHAPEVHRAYNQFQGYSMPQDQQYHETPILYQESQPPVYEMGSDVQYPSETRATQNILPAQSNGPRYSMSSNLASPFHSPPRLQRSGLQPQQLSSFNQDFQTLQYQPLSSSESHGYDDSSSPMSGDTPYNSSSASLFLTSPPEQHAAASQTVNNVPPYSTSNNLLLPYQTPLSPEHSPGLHQRVRRRQEMHQTFQATPDNSFSSFQQVSAYDTPVSLDHGAPVDNFSTSFSPTRPSPRYPSASHAREATPSGSTSGIDTSAGTEDEDLNFSNYLRYTDVVAKSVDD